MSVGYRDVLAAAERLIGRVHRTPVLTSALLNEASGASLYFKCEQLQKVGAFKARGAVNAVFSLNESYIKQGVATHSSGNHGAALARAAALRQVPAYIVVPSTAPRVKQDAIAAYGAEIILCEPTLAAREETLAAVIEQTGAVAVHPYDDPQVIAGQGTVALELVEQVTGLDTIVVPVGGGGLLAGTCLVAEQAGVSVIAAEPAGADDAHRSIVSGQRVTAHAPNTICDGLQTTLGAQNFDIIRPRLEQVVVLEDSATAHAMALIWTRMKQVVEPSAAIVLAAVLANPARFTGRKVGLVLTGGNVDLERLPFGIDHERNSPSR